MSRLPDGGYSPDLTDEAPVPPQGGTAVVTPHLDRSVENPQAAYDRAHALASAWQAFADRLAHELGDDLCTHPPGMRMPMTEERSACGLCGRQFLNY